MYSHIAVSPFRNMASLLVFAQIDDIFHLLTEAEEEVHSLCEGSEILRPPVESKQTTAVFLKRSDAF